MFKKIRGALLGTLLCLMSFVAFAASLININTADEETLSTALKGIGPNKAAAIVHYRTANGPFENVDELLKVKGIGKRTIELNKELIVVE